MSETTKVILTTEEKIAGTFNSIQATIKVILTTVEVITVTLKDISANTKVILAIKNGVSH